MTGFFTEQTLTSPALSGAHALRCTATPTAEKPVGSVPKGEVPSHYERGLALTACTVVHGAVTAPASGTLTGYTTLSTHQRADDPREATLTFDAQRLFDRPWPASFAVLIIVGGPMVTASMGANNKMPVLAGSTEHVRAFALLGADAGLDAVIGKLVGWQATRPVEVTRAALGAAHPLVALDALRVAVQDGAVDAIALAGTDLLHPSNPSGVREAAIELVAAGIAKQKAGSPEAERLIDVALLGWEQEQRARVDVAYIRSLANAAPQLRGSKRKPGAQAVANAPIGNDLVTALKALAAGLK